MQFGKVPNIHGAMAHSPLSAKAAGEEQTVTGREGKVDLGPKLTELSIHVNLNLFTTYFNHMDQTDLELPAAPDL